MDGGVDCITHSNTPKPEPMNSRLIRESGTATARRIGQDRYVQMLDYLNGRPAPALPSVPGRVIRAYDRPLTVEELDGITSIGELALILGIGRHAAKQRITSRAEMAQSQERTNP